MNVMNADQTPDALNITAVDVPPDEVNCTLTAADVNNSAVNNSCEILFGHEMPISSGIISDVNPVVSDPTPILNNQNEEQRLEKELKILRMRHEINTLQRQLQSLECNSVHSSTSRRINYEELDAVVPKFDGEDHQDIVKWFILFEEYTMMSGFGNNELLLGLKWLLRGSARMYIQSLNVTNYTEMKQSLIKHLEGRLPVKKYTTIASQANVNEKELVDIIIDGLQDNSTNISLLYGASTIAKLIECLDRYEQRRIRKAETVTKSKSSNKSDVRCFNYSQFGHFQSTCPKPPRPPGSCFTCHKMGHYNKDCPDRKNHIVASVFQESDNI
ncbi:hypothetical protein CVS40_7040 [Lucilia cuprina]|nr:hypothetical protein CVS40_7040 [Lucilia cuprina]